VHVHYLKAKHSTAATLPVRKSAGRRVQCPVYMATGTGCLAMAWHLPCGRRALHRCQRPCLVPSRGRLSWATVGPVRPVATRDANAIQTWGRARGGHDGRPERRGPGSLPVAESLLGAPAVGTDWTRRGSQQLARTTQSRRRRRSAWAVTGGGRKGAILLAHVGGS
jgi:hypothetical protein